MQIRSGVLQSMLWEVEDEESMKEDEESVEDDEESISAPPFSPISEVGSEEQYSGEDDEPVMILLIMNVPKIHLFKMLWSFTVPVPKVNQ